MRLVLISDTHGLHNQVKLPDGDVLIHSGDCLNHGTNAKEVISFASWFKAQPHRHKILVAGNHDFFFEQYRADCETALGPSVEYLEDSRVTIGGLHFWGSPITPRFFNWAFMRDRGFAIRQHWRMIPDDTNILITHGPPDGMLDECRDGHVGCFDLTRRLETLPNLKLNVFGHIHSGYGVRKVGDLTFVNASQCNEKYRIVNDPIVVDL